MSSRGTISCVRFVEKSHHLKSVRIVVVFAVIKKLTENRFIARFRQNLFFRPIVSFKILLN